MTELNKAEIIEQLLPAILATGNYSRNAAISVLERSSVDELLRMKQRQIASGRLVEQPTPAPPTELELARQEAREIAKKVALQERQQILERQRQLQLQIVTDALFRPNIVIPGQELIDSRANRQQLLSFVNPGEQINNPITWLKKVLAESPELIQRLAWKAVEDRFPISKPLNKQQKAEQDREQRAKDWEAFIKWCYQSEFICAPNEANFEAILRANGGPGLPNSLFSMGITTHSDGTPYCMNADGGVENLVPATPEEKEVGRVEYLKHLAKTNSFSELHQIVREGTHKPVQETPQTKLQSDLAAQYERDTQAGYTDPLPAHITPETIRKWSADEMRQHMRRYGASRITARYHKIYDVRSQHGEVYRFD